MSAVGSPSTDLAWLDRARALAWDGWGQVHPNPMVGCVLVKDDHVVGEGHHGRYGGPHAEVEALARAGAAAQGATAFVSLEPCDHVGQTPPCSLALLQAGVSRVVYGLADPGAESGGGAETLRRGGVMVEGPLWPATHEADNAAFFHHARTGTPFVAVKLALSLDGAIAAEEGAPTRISGDEAQRWVHRLRSGYDAVLIGARTARFDDPSLTVRLAPGGHRAPRRLVVDPDASLDTTGKLFEGTEDAPLHVFVRHDADEAEMERLEGAGAHVHPVPPAPGGVDLGQVLTDCGELGMRSILCEGGGRLAGSLLAEGRAHRLHLVVAPTLLGPDAVPAFPRTDVDLSSFAPSLAPRTLGRDTVLTLDRQGSQR